MFHPKKTQNILKSKKLGLKYLHHLRAPPHFPSQSKNSKIRNNSQTKRSLKLPTKIILKTLKIEKMSKFECVI